MLYNKLIKFYVIYDQDIVLMKTLISAKNISSNQNKKMSSRFLKPEQKISSLESLIFEKKNQLIIHANGLPLIANISGILDQGKYMFSLTVDENLISLKQDEHVSCAPLNFHHKKWLRILFCRTCDKIDVRRKQSENKINKNHYFTDFQNWKTHHAEESKYMIHFFMKDLIKPAEKVTNPKSSFSHFEETKQLSSTIKNKMSERRAYGSNQKFNGLPSINRQKEKTTSILVHHGEPQSKISLYLSKNEDENPSKPDSDIPKTSAQQRDSSTSTTMRREFLESRISTKLKRFKDTMFESKFGKSSKDTSIGGELSHLRDQRPAKPHFYQNLNISQEEFDIRKRKFDSQRVIEPFKSKELRQEVSMNRECKQLKIQVNKQIEAESEVIEEISRSNMMNSSNLQKSQFQETFPELDQGNEKPPSTDKHFEDSEGTLYQSVYQ